MIDFPSDDAFRESIGETVTACARLGRLRLLDLDGLENEPRILATLASLTVRFSVFEVEFVFC